ncbi:MAG: bifunctional precorrin-2 dehydrogenase/sirohydrochlorin ferrochelatase [Lachnospiraceae bacterium]|nr:bifunctional precorrin-2 dehydrogenase/sirohydrochlorin ferrochelatase [Lachnospiraceae bacterium]
MYFPLFLDLSEKNVLVVGAGTIARRRIRALLGFAGHITIVAPRITRDIPAADEAPDGAAAKEASDNAAAGETTGITVLERCFEEEDLTGKDLVLAATDDAALNARISEECRKRGIPVNACTGIEACDFLFPSVIEKNQVVAGVNASGQNHALVKNTRKQIEELLEVREGRYTSGVRVAGKRGADVTCNM